MSTVLEPDDDGNRTAFWVMSDGTTIGRIESTRLGWVGFNERGVPLGGLPLASNAEAIARVQRRWSNRPHGTEMAR